MLEFRTSFIRLLLHCILFSFTISSSLSALETKVNWVLALLGIFMDLLSLASREWTTLPVWVLKVEGKLLHTYVTQQDRHI